MNYDVFVKSKFFSNQVESLFRKYHKRVAVLSKQKLRPTAIAVKDKVLSAMAISALPDPMVAGGHSSHMHSGTVMKEEEEVCPICLSDLVEGESMTLCREGCHNRLHHHCMAVCKYFYYYCFCCFYCFNFCCCCCWIFLFVVLLMFLPVWSIYILRIGKSQGTNIINILLSFLNFKIDFLPNSRWWL